MKKYDDFYTIEEIANKLKISKMTIYRAIKSGELNPINIGTGDRKVYRISKEELSKFLEKRKESDTT